ncbi:MAG: holo-ACP synthase [Gammaproteobacteria bacterium]|nr:MAG: holo-ACP synthase [Gammaproteobacteria bacterium]
MIVGIGTDIIQVDRIQQIWSRIGQRFAQRILTVAELEEFETKKNKAAFLAKRFSAKEAIAKALGTGIAKGVTFQNVGVGHDELGKPLILLSGAALDLANRLEISHHHLSITDEREYVVSFAVFERS